MQKKILLTCLLAAISLGLFEFYLFYLGPHEMNLPDFFSSILSSLISGQSSKIIRINLYNKSLTLIDSGVLVKEAKIAAAGHPRATPTPTGNFAVLLKDKRHISGLSGLVMPLSLRFYNGYFLHGLPTTLSGRIIDTPYSNGCIRLPSGLDEEIFNWADIGTKVEIYNSSLVKSEETPTVFYLRQDGTKEPISSPEEFLSRGFRWQDVKTIPLVELDAFPLASSTPTAAIE